MYVEDTGKCHSDPLFNEGLVAQLLEVKFTDSLQQSVPLETVSGADNCIAQSYASFLGEATSND